MYSFRSGDSSYRTSMMTARDLALFLSLLLHQRLSCTQGSRGGSLEVIPAVSEPRGVRAGTRTPNSHSNDGEWGEGGNAAIPGGELAPNTGKNFQTFNLVGINFLACHRRTASASATQQPSEKLSAS